MSNARFLSRSPFRDNAASRDSTATNSGNWRGTRRWRSGRNTSRRNSIVRNLVQSVKKKMSSQKL